MNSEYLAKIPAQPGVYLHKSADGTILYVGKAKNLRKRIASYFANKPQDAKTKALVRFIANTDVVVTRNEIEAFLLENRLIKQHRPKFNIQLKDNRRYSYIQITREEYPRVLAARTVNKKDRFFGPYTFPVRHITTIASELFGIRRCLSTQKTPCFYYTIGRCSGPCAGAVSSSEYAQGVQEFIHFLSNPPEEIIAEYRARMLRASSELAFEKAAYYKKCIATIEQFKEKQIVDRIRAHDQDVIGIASLGDRAVITLLQVKHGVMTNKESLEVLFSEEILSEFLKAYYTTHSIPHQIVVDGSFDPAIVDYLKELAGRHVEIIRPKRGVACALVELAKKNSYAQLQIEDPVLIALKEMLGLATLPASIDCFDISNYGDKVVVGACVQFKNGKPYKNAWRHYNIKGDFGQDDFRSMAEVITRHYASNPLPDLIIIDGGMLQVQFAQQALKAKGLDCAIVGLAKQEETIIFSNGAALVLKRKEPAARLIMRIRDATHNFAIGHSRTRFAKHYKQSILDEIPSIGAKTKFKLLHELGSLEAIEQAPFETLVKIIGQARAKKIQEYLQARHNPRL